MGGWADAYGTQAEHAVELETGAVVAVTAGGLHCSKDKPEAQQAVYWDRRRELLASSNWCASVMGGSKTGSLRLSHKRSTTSIFANPLKLPPLIDKRASEIRPDWQLQGKKGCDQKTR